MFDIIYFKGHCSTTAQQPGVRPSKYCLLSLHLCICVYDVISSREWKSVRQILKKIYSISIKSDICKLEILRP